MEEPLPEQPAGLREHSSAEESFESAVPAALQTTAGSESIGEDAAVNRPSIDEMLAPVPSPTKDALKKLFLIQPEAMKVRKIRTERLR